MASASADVIASTSADVIGYARADDIASADLGRVEPSGDLLFVADGKELEQPEHLRADQRERADRD
jgi:hypothetical protein